MTRAAIYARMSTDKQNERSPADQVRECRRYAERQGYDVVPELIFEEAGVSGASRHNRPRLLELVARIDEWDVLLAFDFSRLARNQEDLGWIANRLRLHRRQAFEASTGLDLANIGSRVLAVVNEEYLVKLAHDTRRGLRGRFERGLSAGARPYGYRSVLADPSDPARGVRWEIAPEQGAVVSRIFEAYATGDGYRSIAERLNREGVPSPRRRGWGVSALHPLLRNPIYRGERIWNRSEWVKDHETSRRRRFERPSDEWLRDQDEALRIVTDELWESVQARLKTPSRQRQSAGGKRGRYVLSGLLQCGVCGSGFWALDRVGVFGCGGRKDRGQGSCDNASRIAHDELVGRLTAAMREHVLTPENAAYVADRALERVERALSASAPERDRERLAEVERELERAVELAVRVGGDLEAVARKLEALKRERADLAARLAAVGRVDREALRVRLAGLVADLRRVVVGAPAAMRKTFEALLKGGRMLVLPDAEQGYRVEGVFVLSPKRLRRTPEDAAQEVLVAGAGTVPARRIRIAAAWPIAA
jgi:DNA invertase Pin-like site-specific DNA recombinase